MEQHYKICNNCGASVLEMARPPVIKISFTELEYNHKTLRYCNSTDCVDTCFEKIDEGAEIIATYHAKTETSRPATR
jgi:hypothetical protein